MYHFNKCFGRIINQVIIGITIFDRKCRWKKCGLNKQCCSIWLGFKRSWTYLHLITFKTTQRFKYPLEPWTLKMMYFCSSTYWSPITQVWAWHLDRACKHTYAIKHASAWTCMTSGSALGWIRDLHLCRITHTC